MYQIPFVNDCDAAQFANLKSCDICRDEIPLDVQFVYKEEEICEWLHRFDPIQKRTISGINVHEWIHSKFRRANCVIDFGKTLGRCFVSG